MRREEFCYNPEARRWSLVRNLVARVRETQRAEERTRNLLIEVFDRLPTSPHLQVETVTGIGKATAAVLVATVVDMRRFATPEHCNRTDGPAVEGVRFDTATERCAASSDFTQ